MFDPEGEDIHEHALHVNVEMGSAMTYGTVSESTVSFWEKQPEEVRNTLFDPEPIPLKDALVEFVGYVDSFKRKPKFIWGCSPRFDIGILHHAFGGCGLKFPYVFWKEMDVRTLKNWMPKELHPERQGMAHSAVDDCVWQCRLVQGFHRTYMRK